MRDTILWLARNLPSYAEAADMALPDFKRLMAHPAWPMLRRLWRAEELRQTGRDSACRRAWIRAGKIDPSQIAPHPFVNGADLQQMGVPEGPRVGRILRAVYELQLAEELTRRSQALAKARQLTDE